MFPSARFLVRPSALCLLVVALAASPAPARSVVQVRGSADVTDPEGGAFWTTVTLQTVLAGRRVAISAYDHEVIPRVLLMRRNGSVRLLPEFDGPLDLPAITFYRFAPHAYAVGGQTQAIAASSTLLVVANSYSTRNSDFGGYRVGGFHRPPGRWHRCPGIAELFAIPLAVSGSAFAHPICDAKSIGVVVRDLRRRGSPARRLKPPAGYRLGQLDLPSVKMAGRFLALRSGEYSKGVLQVFDWRSGREVYRVPPSELSDDFGFSVQPDGKVAITQRDIAPVETSCERHTRIAWYSPREPWPHTLPYRPCGPELAMARDRIVYPGSAGLGSALFMTDTRGRKPLRLSGMLGYWDPSLPPFDFDGTRIAYGQTACIDERVVRDKIRSIARRGYLRAMTCPLQFAGRNGIDEGWGGTISVRVRCPAGCKGAWSIDTVGRHHRMLVDGGDFRLPPGIGTLHSVESALPQKYASRKPAHRRVRLVIRAQQPNGPDRTATRTITILTTRLAK